MAEFLPPAFLAACLRRSTLTSVAFHGPRRFWMPLQAMDKDNATSDSRQLYLGQRSKVSRLCGDEFGRVLKRVVDMRGMNIRGRVWGFATL